jgi:dynein heavy chain
MLVHDKWLPDMIEREIPMTAGVVPLDVLSTDSLKAQWGIEVGRCRLTPNPKHKP